METTSARTRERVQALPAQCRHKPGPEGTFLVGIDPNWTALIQTARAQRALIPESADRCHWLKWWTELATGELAREGVETERYFCRHRLICGLCRTPGPYLSADDCPDNPSKRT